MVRKKHPPPKTPFTLTSVAPTTWYRVHPIDPITRDYPPDAYNASGKGNARFSPLRRPDNNEVIPTIYAAQSHRGAIAETVLHDVPFPSSGYLHDLERDRRSSLHLSEVGLPALKLANLTATGLRGPGILPSELFEGNKSDYPRTRKWALWIWENMPAAQGLLWMSKQDTQSLAVMLFGDRISAPIVDRKQSRHVIHYEDLIVELLAEMQATVCPAL
ncbi:RES family NAD+ phosphorylase [Paraburkholderia sp. J8-2]|uniref:RES family NAD+ phosphorylase n=1 Tax=Paraburkholderia sp. J8-2 TaxID=2805440 RepID=UPI002AB5EBD8|nr:RES family NAD+ phosphorylase [Paraburkholderia sp. J8-2]